MTERTTILIVDDESKIRRLLSRSLEAEGFDVAVADSAMSASEYLKNGHCDLIILDYMMPEIDGMAFLAELRKKSSIPVIMLSAREEIAKKTQALELGADDYVVKPFSIEEMTARIRAILRRSGGVKTRPYRQLTDLSLWIPINVHADTRIRKLGLPILSSVFCLSWLNGREPSLHTKICFGEFGGLNLSENSTICVCPSPE